jgi:hypothetical protein
LLQHLLQFLRRHPTNSHLNSTFKTLQRNHLPNLIDIKSYADL